MTYKFYGQFSAYRLSSLSTLMQTEQPPSLEIAEQFVAYLMPKPDQDLQTIYS